MRVVLAGLFVVFTLSIAVALVAVFVPQLEQQPLVLGLSLAALMLILCVGAGYIFNRPEDRFIEFRTAESFMQELAAKGLLVSSEFRATRALRIAEFDDEGSHYFIELENGSVLYLNGQYLYDYEPIDDDPEVNQPRNFPCTEFTVHRHKVEGYVVEIVCRGRVLDPEITAPAFEKVDKRRGALFGDGQVLTDRTYEQIRQEHIKNSGQPG
jgi:hypothetical protein